MLGCRGATHHGNREQTAGDADDDHEQKLMASGEIERLQLDSETLVGDAPGYHRPCYGRDGDRCQCSDRVAADNQFKPVSGSGKRSSEGARDCARGSRSDQHA